MGVFVSPALSRGPARVNSLTHNTRLVLATGAALALLGLSLGLAQIDLGAFRTPAALAISSFKSVIIVLLFMELRQRGPLTWVVLAAGLGWLGVLFALSLGDFLSRGWR